MSVTNGQRANQTTFNNAFMSRTANTSTSGKVDLNNADGVSGASLSNIQRALNSLLSVVGASASAVYNLLPTWNTSEGTLTSLQTLLERVDALSDLFESTAGHTHVGAGQGGPLDEVSLSQAGILSDGALPQSIPGDKFWYGFQWVRDQFSFQEQNLDAASVTGTMSKSAAVVHNVTGTGPSDITGFDPGTAGQMLIVVNRTAQDLTIYHEDGGESATSRIQTIDGDDMVLVQNQVAAFLYNEDLERWICILDTSMLANGAGGSGGGGGSLEWVEDDNAPIPAVENADRVYLFEALAAQELFALVRVPSGYTPGDPISMKALWYSPDSSGDVLMKAQATLIKPGTDAMSSTTNQRTTTNTAVTLGAGTVNEAQAVTLDITSSIGEINSVAVAPGDLIRVRFYRDTDTATSDVRALPYGAEVTFS